MSDKPMSDKPRYHSKDLYNEITDGISLAKAIRYRDILRGMDRALPFYLISVAVLLAVFALILCGAIYISELITPPEMPTNWEEQGVFIFSLFFGLWGGVVMATAVIVDSLKAHVRRYIDEKVNDVLAGFNDYYGDVKEDN